MTVTQLLFKKIIEKLSSSIDAIVSNMLEATSSNISYLQAVPIPIKYSVFWKTYFKTKSVHISVKKSTRRTISGEITIRIRNCMKRFRNFCFKCR